MHPNHGPAIDPSREEFLLPALRHPQFFERFEAILALSQPQSPRPQTADQIEALLSEQLRKLGHQTMEQWANGAEEQVAEQLATETPRVRRRKKNS